MVAEEVIVTLSGGAPWGFRLQGGMEHQKPLQVAKVRKRSKACRAGLHEGDELVSINDSPCGGLSHAQAMTIIDSSPGTLHIRVRRSAAGFQSVVLPLRAPSPRIDKEYRAALRAMSPPAPATRPQQPAVRQVHSIMSPTGTGTSRSGLTSPPCSEAYYGETDSDADVVAQERQRRQKPRRSPSNSVPGGGTKAGRGSPEGGETSEMSGYDSAPDPSWLGGPEMKLPGVARREVIYQPPPHTAWSSQTSTETSSMSADDGPPEPEPAESQSAREDSGFQDLPVVPLVSPERAKEALMLSSRRQLVPMVGPVDMPVDEELTVTYMDKAKQAKLGRGDTVQDKQVKEARTKCRTIASLLTDAPNPHSRGVLMFKKRRQRSKKYTLTSYGSVDEDMRQEEDSQEEDGMFPGSESEFDEDGFSAAPDPTWDSDYMDMLERRSASVVGHTEDTQSAGLMGTSGKGAQLFEQQRKRAEEHAKKAAIAQAQVEAQVQAQAQAQAYAQSQALAQAQVLAQIPGQMQMQMSMHNHMQPELQTEPLAHAHVQALVQPALPAQQQPQYPPMHVPSHPVPQPPPVAPKPQQKPREVPLPPVQHLPAVPTAPPAPVVAAQSLPVMTNGDAMLSQQANVPSLVPEVAQVAAIPVGPAVSVLQAPPQTPVPESSSSSVLNRTAQPFAPGFISNRASTAPVVFRPSVSKKSPRPVSVAVVQPGAADEMAMSYAQSTSAPSLVPAPVPHPAVIPTIAPAPIPMVPPSVPVVQPDPRVAMAPMGPPPVSVVPTAPMPAPVVMPAAPLVTAPVPMPAPAPMPVPMHVPAPMPTSAPMPVSAPMPMSAPVPASPQLARISSSMENIQAAAVGLPPQPMPPMEHVAPLAQMAPVAATMAMPVAPPAPVRGPAPALVPVQAPVSAPVPIEVPTPAQVQLPAPADQVPALSSAPAASVPADAGTAADLPGVPSSPAAVHQSRLLRGTTAGGRTGILQEARRRSSGRRMFHVPEEKKNSPNPTLLSMVQNLDETRTRYRYSDPVTYDYEEEMEDPDAGDGKLPPPVAPKPRVIPEATQIPQAEGKGAELFARRQSRMDQYVVDAPVSPTNPETPQQHLLQQQPQQLLTRDPRDPSPTQSLPSQFKYSPNVRAPPPIGYNPLMGPSFPMSPQRDNARLADPRAGRAGYGAQKEGIKALDFLRRQPYQLNSAMFGGSTTSLQASQASQPQRQYGQQQQGYTLNAPRQIPVKAARVYEIKRFSTPTPMSAPTLTTKVIAPRSATTLGDRISRVNMTSPPPAPQSPPPAPVTAPKPAPALAPILTPTPAPYPHPPAIHTGGLPDLPKISAAPVPNAHPLPYTPSAAPMSSLAYGGLQSAKHFKSAPELSALPPLRPAPVQVPKPRFVATRVGIQPRVWRPGALP